MQRDYWFSVARNLGRLEPAEQVAASLRNAPFDA